MANKDDFRQASRLNIKRNKGQQSTKLVVTKLNCDKLWAEVQALADKIVKENNVSIRSKLICEAYGNLYFEEKRFQWIAFGTIASKQVGCAMRTATRASWVAFFEDDKIARDLRNELGKGNKLLFRDIYPQHMLLHKYGLKTFLECASSRKLDGNAWPVSREMIDAFKLINSVSKSKPWNQKTLSKATAKIAYHEQINILHKYMYSQDLFTKPLKINRQALKNTTLESNLKHPLLAAGKILTLIEEPQISFSVSCDSKNKVIFKDAVKKELPHIKPNELNIIDKKQRLAFVKVAQEKLDYMIVRQNKRFESVIAEIKSLPAMDKAVWGKVLEK